MTNKTNTLIGKDHFEIKKFFKRNDLSIFLWLNMNK